MLWNTNDVGIHILNLGIHILNLAMKGFFSKLYNCLGYLLSKLKEELMISLVMADHTMQSNSTVCNSMVWFKFW